MVMIDAFDPKTVALLALTLVEDKAAGNKIKTQPDLLAAYRSLYAALKVVGEK